MLILVIFIGFGRKMALRPGGGQNLVEMTYEFIDNGITKDVVGHDAGRFTPFLGALFLFILFLNFWEVIPFIQFPPTSRMGIPGFLALMVYFVYLFTGFKNQGIKYLTGHLFPPGVPKALYVLVTPDRVRAAVPRAALLAGSPTPRQHDGGPHPAHRPRAADGVRARERRRSSPSARSP